FEMPREFRSVDHELLGHAAADDAGPAHAMLLGDGHPRARHGRHPGRTHAAGAGADDEEVVVVVRQEGLLGVQGSISTTPSAVPTRARSARSRNRPWSTTPVTLFSAAARTAGSSLRPQGTS